MIDISNFFRVVVVRRIFQNIEKKRDKKDQLDQIYVLMT